MPLGFFMKCARIAVSDSLISKKTEKGETAY